MPTYRAYTLSPAGKITSGQWIEAADLDEARRIARELCNTEHPVVELWQGARQLDEIECHEGAA